MFKLTTKHYKRIGSNYIEIKLTFVGITLYSHITEF